MVQIMYIHVYKCKNDNLLKLFQESREGRRKRAVEEVNSNMIYLIHYKNSCKCYNVPPQSTTIILKNRKPTYIM
jgi:hypothetical protein